MNGDLFIAIALLLSAAACVRWDVLAANRRADRERDRRVRDEMDRLIGDAKR